MRGAQGKWWLVMHAEATKLQAEVGTGGRHKFIKLNEM
jgi:hypothetical protein